MAYNWHIVRAQHGAFAFDGEGSRRYGGRWNREGIPMVYAAESLSLAALELLVHLDASQIMDNFVCIPVQFDESLCLRIDQSDLPTDWTTYPVLHAIQNIGTTWFNSGVSALLAVPSVIVPIETNYLINPLHPNFDKLKIGDPNNVGFFVFRTPSLSPFLTKSKHLLLALQFAYSEDQMKGNRNSQNCNYRRRQWIWQPIVHRHFIA